MNSKDCKTENKSEEVVVVMVPLPAQGHLNQLIHLSHLITTYGIPVHFAASSTHNHQAKLRLHGWTSQLLTKITFHDFQLIAYDSVLPTIDISDPYPIHLQPLFEAYIHLRAPVSQLIQQLSKNFKRVIVVHDILISSIVQDVKQISNAEAYTLFPTCAFYYFLQFWGNIPENQKPFELDSNDLPEYLPTFEGCVTPYVLEFAMKQMQCLGFESGWIFNTSRVIEGKYVKLLEKLISEKRGDLKHFAIGPFHPLEISEEKQGENRHECLVWLDKQQEGSVIFVSFGSTTSLTDEQIEELANGLERSGKKFIWAVRAADPNDVFKESDKIRRPQLPEGFENRVEDRGIVVRDWAPQLEILAHSSTGGFMSHCGWNSCIESISMGVPIAAWPMHSDQPRNATLITQVLKIGVMVRHWEDRKEVVRSSTIENVVKTLMASKEGKEMQERAKELGEIVRGSLVEGGVSCLERDSFIAHISR